ncbi:SAF domain-containing protein [Solwaraspora sp. WMMA2080]|uniref:SAF domain-containing protein n=1 Tax=unclassified Solwaraspora TaxID=2627926 RepID=UPI00248CA5AE|nr:MULTISPECIES: SAF domain-containing protein [unclassified Solwaraspora]WBB96791.1 SAF domain-containing protein [Solwaraspora sp. WMMA2059]WBC19304.1 SAF domain-containing protein [Solwaraspora sp. WMMA2080]
MTVATTRTGQSGVDAPVTPPKIVRQRRVRPGLLGLAVLLIALGGLGSAFAVTSVRATGSYLAVARDVSVGAVLSADDLVTVQVAGGQAIKPVPASQLDQVVGLRAAVALVPGSLLTPAQLTNEPMIGPDQQQIAIGLRADQVPARQLNPGDKLILVGTPTRNASENAVTRFDATVIDVAADDRSGIIAYLALAARDVPAVVVLAAEDRIAVVLAPAA